MADPTPAEIARACGTTPSRLCESVLRATGSEAWAGAAEWLWSYPLTILGIVIVAVIVNRVVRKLIGRSMNHLLDPATRSARARRALRTATPDVLLRTGSVNLRTEARVRTLTTVFRSLATVLIWFTAAVSILQVLSISLAPLLASAGLLTVAFGFGAQGIVRDFLAGTFMVVEDQFGVGDIVDIGEAKGTVEAITLRATRVRDVNGTLWHVPNGQIQRVANKSQQWARAVLDIEVDVSVEYESTAALIQQVADAMASEDGWLTEVVDTPQVWGIESFTPDGYTIRLVVKTRPASQFGVMRELRIRLQRAFAEHGIRWPGQSADISAELERRELARQAAAALGATTEEEVVEAAEPKPPPTRGDPAEAV